MTSYIHEVDLIIDYAWAQNNHTDIVIQLFEEGHFFQLFFINIFKLKIEKV
jgi:hypothetical protein